MEVTYPKLKYNSFMFYFKVYNNFDKSPELTGFMSHINLFNTNHLP